jgi:hypothetical protein
MKIRYGNREKCENCKYMFTKDNVLFCAKTINFTRLENYCEKFKMKDERDNR